ncbi:hypothetical protein SHINM1_017980 [Fluviibacter phosphoraccumulans]|nr:hypothetical protein SHINM1_017980 [Fluviibacter phosphoraccumulans]
MLEIIYKNYNYFTSARRLMLNTKTAPDKTTILTILGEKYLQLSILYKTSGIQKIDCLKTSTGDEENDKNMTSDIKM